MADNFEALVHDGIVNSYSPEELRTLCFLLKINPDWLKQDDLRVLARELIATMGRNGRLNDLIAQLRQERPRVLWPDAPIETTRIQSIPMQLPLAATHFTGRDPELDQLLKALQPGHVVTLYGPGGIGKTALAAKALQSLFPLPGSENPGEGLSRFPSGVLYHSFYGRPAAADCAFEFARACSVDPISDPFTALATALYGRVALLIFDGVEEADDLDTLLQRRGRCGVLITSRRREDALRGNEMIEVDRLPLEESLALMQALAGRLAEDEVTAAEICELCGNLPLALRLAGAFMFREGQTAAEYLAWLHDSGLAALDFGDRRQKSVPILMSKSVAQVSDQARSALAVVGCLAITPFDVRPVVKALGMSEYEARRALGDLVNYELLRRSGDRYEATHTLVHSYARERLSVKPDAMRRLWKYYSDLVGSESARGLPGYHRLESERSHVLAILQRLAVVGEWKLANRLVRSIDKWLDLQGYPHDQITARKVGIAAARSMENLADQGEHLNSLGIIYANLGQVEEAVEHYKASLIIFREIGDRKGEEAVLGNLGTVYANMGQVEEAVKSFEASLVIAREIGDRQGVGTWLGNLSIAYRIQGHVNQAIVFGENALAIARETSGRREEGARLGILGLAYVDLGNIEQAIEFYEAALDINRQLGDRRIESITLGNLGLAYYSLGQVDQAIAFYEAALDIDRQIGSRPGESIALGNLGLAYAHLGQMEEAIEYFEAALTLSRGIFDRRGEGFWLGCLGNVYHHLGQLEQALEYQEAALEVIQAIGDHPLEGSVLANLSLINADLGRTEQAIEFHTASLAIYEEIKGQAQNVLSWSGLGVDQRNLKYADRALINYDTLLAIARERSDQRDEADHLFNRALALGQLGRREEAATSFEAAIVAYQTIDALTEATYTREQLSRLRGDW